MIKSDHLHTILTAESPHSTFAIDLHTAGQQDDAEFVCTVVADNKISQRFVDGQNHTPMNASGDSSSISSILEVSHSSKQTRSMFSLIVVDDVDACLAAEPYKGITGVQTPLRKRLRGLRDIRLTQYTKILDHLEIVRKADPTSFDVFPRRISPVTNAASLSQANNYRLAFDTSKIDFRVELLWSCSPSGAISAVLYHSSNKPTCIRVEKWIQEIMRHQSIMSHPMAMPIISCFELLPHVSSANWEELERIEAELPDRFGTSYSVATDTNSISQLLSVVSRDTSSITNCRSRLASRKAMVDIILTECEEVTRCPTSSMNEREWREASEYIQIHARHQSRDIAQAISDIEIWQQRANNLVQNVCNLVAQQHAQENLMVARDMKLQAEASKNIAEATMRDSASMRAISAVTMIYLPGSFLSSLFSTGFFRWDAPPGETLIDPRIGYFWAFAIPTTIFTVLIWYAWDRFVNAKAIRRTSEYIGKLKTENLSARQTLRPKMC